MMRIDRIRVVLPSQLGAHAQTIATGVAQNLAASGPHPATRIAHLRVPSIRVDAAASAPVIAEQAARAILLQLRDRHD